MNEFRLTIRIDNAAFEDDPAGAEIARILQEAADNVSEYGVPRHTQSVFDINGNRVGGYKLVEGE